MFNFIHLSQTLYKPKNPPAVNKELNVITGTDKMVEEWTNYESQTAQRTKFFEELIHEQVVRQLDLL